MPLVTEAKEQPKRRRVSGPSGANKQPIFGLRAASVEQLEAWKAAAARAGVTLTAWIRDALDRAAQK
jgi:hypothetical protein